VRDIVGNALGGLSYGRILARLVWVFIIGLGVIAALNQIGVAIAVTTPILIAVLATIAGVIIVGVGGGLVRPMQQRWEIWLDRAAQESQTIAEHAKAYNAGQADTATALTPQPTPAAEPAAGVAPAPDQTPAPPPAYPVSSSDPTQVLPPVTGEPPTTR
jgi:hypothetical protein